VESEGKFLKLWLHHGYLSRGEVPISQDVGLPNGSMWTSLTGYKYFHDALVLRAAVYLYICTKMHLLGPLSVALLSIGISAQDVVDYTAILTTTEPDPYYGQSPKVDARRCSLKSRLTMADIIFSQHQWKFLQAMVRGIQKSSYPGLRNDP